MSTAGLKNELRDWAKEKRQELGPEIISLIGKAKYDLYYGPSGGGLEEDYPGFEKATKKISAALDDVVPSTLYIDTQAGGWSDSEPDWEEEDEEGVRSYHQEDWYKVDRKDLIAALVGDELAQYVR
jgi:hypothetical protein